MQADPAVDTVVGFTGGGRPTRGFVFISLKPLAERKISADQVIRAAARQARRGRRARGSSCSGGVRPARRRTAEQRALPIHAARRRHARTLQLGAEDCRGAAEERGAEGRQHRPAAGRSRSRHRRSTATPRRGSASRPARSTTRSTTPSASARSRPSTTPSTSTTCDGGGAALLAGPARRSRTSSVDSRAPIPAARSRPTPSPAQFSASTATRDLRRVDRRRFGAQPSD